jgi:hypothetical protein
MVVFWGNNVIQLLIHQGSIVLSRERKEEKSHVREKKNGYLVIVL